MNIHEHQAKEILRKFGAPVPNGVVILNLKDISEKVKKLNTKKLILKAQIHAGGRGKAGGIKLIKNKNELFKETKEMFGKILVTPQTGSVGTVKQFITKVSGFGDTLTINEPALLVV